MKKVCRMIGYLSFVVYVGFVAYNWGWMEYAISHDLAAFSAPAYVSIFSGFPFLIVSIVCLLYVLISKSKERK